MGLGVKNLKGTGTTFSNDVLCLEICGPQAQHFSVIDVPGIFRKTTEGLTTKEDQQIVLAMVRRYMENPRSIMLTVVPANVDIATQEILTLAEEVDPDGIRTLGVLTKPDLVDDGAEKSVIQLIKGVGHNLELGWYILRNPGQKELEQASTNRNAIEEIFFQNRCPWNKIDKERVGIEALKTRLQEILADKIRHEFPKVGNYSR
jgi:Dynamin family/Dynamin central region